MANPLDNAKYNHQGFNAPQNLQQAYQAAMQNPKAFIENMKRTNPQAVQRAMQLAQCNNPQAVVMQMLQARGMTPGMFNIPGFN